MQGHTEGLGETMSQEVLEVFKRRKQVFLPFSFFPTRGWNLLWFTAVMGLLSLRPSRYLHLWKINFPPVLPTEFENGSLNGN